MMPTWQATGCDDAPPSPSPTAARDHLLLAPGKTQALVPQQPETTRCSSRVKQAELPEPSKVGRIKEATPTTHVILLGDGHRLRCESAEDGAVPRRAASSNDREETRSISL